MKIAFISLMRILPWGGSEELWFRTAKLAISNGYEVCTFTQNWDEKPESIVQLNKLGAISNFFYKPEYSLLDRIALRIKIKRHLPEVMPFVEADIYVISNGTTFDFTRNKYIIEQITKTGKPYILISQHNFENGHILGEVDRGYAVNILQNSIKNLFVSERNLNCAERQIAHKIANSAVISNPVNIATISIKAFPVSEKLLMACVARLDCDVKGQDILLQVLSAERWKERDYSLNLYGTGPDYNYLGNLISFYGLEEKVFLKGHVKNIDQVWESNQVLVLSSLNEGTPLALVEAMLSGRAAVATNVGDDNKYVLDGATGFLASVASLESLGEALEKLWFAKHDLQLMGNRAFNHALRITDLEPEKTLLHTIESVKDIN